MNFGTMNVVGLYADFLEVGPPDFGLRSSCRRRERIERG